MLRLNFPVPRIATQGMLIKRLLPALLLVNCMQYAFAASAPLQLVERIPLPGVTGRIDHMAVDLEQNRLFIAALGNDSLEVVDLHKGKRIRSIKGLSEPQGVIFIADRGLLVIANGGNGVCLVMDARTFKPVARLDLHSDADNLRYDAASGGFLAAYGNGAIAMFDRNFHRSGDIPLPGHPEAFTLDRDTGRMFINVPAAGAVFVADIRKLRLAQTWALQNAAANFPMALNKTNDTLLVGTRRPPQISAIDTLSGKAGFSVPVDADPDDIFIDSVRQRVYVACGAGYIDILEWSAGGVYRMLDRIPSAPGARTALYVPEQQRLYLAVPRRGQRDAAIWVYR